MGSGIEAVGMAKTRKQATAPEPPPLPQVGDKVIPERSEATYVITGIRSGGDYVDLKLPGTNLERFHIDVTTLKFVDRVQRKPAPNLDVEVRFDTIQRENLKRLDDDIAILTKYLKTQGAPKAVIDTLGALRDEQEECWNAAAEQIAALMKK
jgi:hypothetical protein